MKLNLTSRLAGDLGIYVYTSNGGCAALLIPRISWSFGAGFITQLAFQLGDRYSATVSCSKSIGNNSVTVYAVANEEEITPILSISRALSQSTTCRLDIAGGERQACEANITKVFGSRKKVNGGVKITEGTCDLSARYSYRLNSHVYLKASETITVKNYKKEIGVISNPQVGISLRFRSSLRVGYFVEPGPTDLRFIVKLKNAGFGLKIPVSVTRIISKKNIGICCAVAIGASIASYYLYKIITQSSKALDKNTGKAFLLAEKRQDHCDFVSSIQDRVIKIRDDEEATNGLVILKGLYGNVNRRDEEIEGDVIDVTDVLQLLVDKSRLCIPAKSKEKISGFFNPCERIAPVLYIKYKFANTIVEVIAKDKEPVLIP